MPVECDRSYGRSVSIWQNSHCRFFPFRHTTANTSSARQAKRFQVRRLPEPQREGQGGGTPAGERLRTDGLKVWFDEWVLPVASVHDRPGEDGRSQSAATVAKIEEGLEHSRVLVLCMSAHAFGSDWAQLEAGTFRFRDPLNKERRFIPLRLDDAPIKGCLPLLAPAG
jgi:hypothetical protein